jgi:hypothetical protein
MAEEEGGRWDVGVKDNQVFLVRLSNDGERLFDEQLEAHEARQLGELLTKFAARADEVNDRQDRDDDSDDDNDDDDKDDDDKDDDDKDDDDSDDDKVEVKSKGKDKEDKGKHRDKDDDGEDDDEDDDKDEDDGK